MQRKNQIRKLEGDIQIIFVLKIYIYMGNQNIGNRSNKIEFQAISGEILAQLLNEDDFSIFWVKMTP